MRYTPTALCPMVAALPPHTRSHANSGPAPIEAIKKRTHAASTEESRAVSESGESTAAGAEASPSPWQQGHKTRYKGRPARVLRRHKPQPEPRPWVTNCQVRFISALGDCCWLRKELALLAVTARKADFGLNLDEHIHRPRFIFFSSFSQAARMQIKLPVPTSASARTERGVGRSERASKSVPEGSAGVRGAGRGRGEPASPPSPCLVLPREPRSGPLPRCPKPAGSGQQPHARAGGRARVSTRELLVPRWGPAGARFSRRGKTRSGPKFD